VIPSDLTDYFTASSAVAGTLIGLLFVSISLRYDVIFGPAAEFRNRSIAGAGFTALANALALSLWALIPHVNLGYPATVSAVLCLASTLQRHVGRSSRRETWSRLFLLAMAVYLFQLVNAIWLIASPHDSGIVDNLAYTVFGAFAAGLSRSWQLLEPASEPATDPQTRR
jgi:hypothetical protein